jgi:glycosyltransferase involved in cell wall biosynthesis
MTCCDFDTSVVMPFFKKMREFRAVLPRNVAHLERNGIEVVIVVDEPTESNEVVEFILRYPLVNWQVIVNPNKHTWRNPAKAINVGIRQASKKYVLVVSPESEFLTDVIAILHEGVEHYPGYFAFGKICYLPMDKHVERNSYSTVPFTHWGSIMVERESLMKIRGYREDLQKWGGDDVNLRARLQFLGLKSLLCDDARLAHREPPGSSSSGQRLDQFLPTKEVWAPTKLHANGEEWGHDFKTVTYSWRTKTHTHQVLPEYLERYRESYIASPMILGEHKRVVCLVQSYNESRIIESFLSHVSSFCDGIILLDDGSDDDTFNVANHEKLLIKVKKSRKGFNDLSNRNMLLDLASFIPADWFFFLDVDERFDRRFDSVYSVLGNPAVQVVTFKLVHLWEDEHHYRVDYPQSDEGVQVKWRMFRNKGRMQIHSGKALHFQPVPFVKGVFHSNIVVLHSGMMTRDARRRKVDFYHSIDIQRDQADYSHLLQERVRLKNIEMLDLAIAREAGAPN